MSPDRGPGFTEGGQLPLFFPYGRPWITEEDARAIIEAVDAARDRELAYRESQKRNPLRRVLDRLKGRTYERGGPLASPQYSMFLLQYVFRQRMLPRTFEEACERAQTLARLTEPVNIDSLLENAQAPKS